MIDSEPPAELDGAVVLSFAEMPKDYKGKLGIFNEASNDYEDGPLIRYLTTAKYESDDSQQYYLFACSQDWEVLGDLVYDSEELAMTDATRYYAVEDIVWIRKRNI